MKLRKRKVIQLSKRQYVPCVNSLVFKAKIQVKKKKRKVDLLTRRVALVKECICAG